MNWSRLRKVVEGYFAPELQGRVAIHVTRHHHRSRRTRAWICIDGVEIAMFCDDVYRHPDYPWKERPASKYALAKKGEFQAWDFKDACWKLVHDGVERALQSGDPLQQSLAVLHRKVGRRRLSRYTGASSKAHPMVRYLAEFRQLCGATPNNAMQRSALVVTPLARTASGSQTFQPASGAPTARRR